MDGYTNFTDIPTQLYLLNTYLPACIIILNIRFYFLQNPNQVFTIQVHKKTQTLQTW